MSKCIKDQMVNIKIFHEKNINSHLIIIANVGAPTANRRAQLWCVMCVCSVHFITTPFFLPLLFRLLFFLINLIM